MAETRVALLIGVASTPDAEHRFGRLEEAVAADQRALGDSLRAAGYTVETLPHATRAEITTTIHEVSRRVPSDGTLLIHFSGHGIRVGDTDYLVPADARAPHTAGDAWWQPYLATLVPADISPFLAASAAGTVLWLIDACRSGDTDGTEPFGSRILRGQPSGRFAVMTACGPAQQAGFTSEGSFFTLALAEALGPLTRARTVQEVYEAAKQRTVRMARRRAGARQEPQVYYGTELGEEARTAVVCEGRPLLDAWRGAAVDTPLWERVTDREGLGVRALQEHLAALAETCASVVHLAQKRMPDPWADDAFPVRLLRDRLPGLLPKAVRLDPVEAAALVAAPFLYEAARARLLSQARDIKAYTVWRREDGDAWRRHYEQVAEHHPHIAQKVSACWLNGSREEAMSVALWLVHRWIEERFETDEDPVPDVEAGPFAAALLSRQGDGGGRAPALAAALRAVAAGIAVGAPEEDPPGLASGRILLPGGHQTLRLRELAGLLRLAAVLALDARTLPDVIAEHLAVSDPVLPQDVVDGVRRAAWDTDDHGTHLDLECSHPALHAALAGVVEHADELARALRESAQQLPPSRAGLLAGVPARVTDRGLRPSGDNGRNAYDVPLLRFSLAQTEVRDLLMGERLYEGESALAVRELYQNAMDACRYRAMRWRYLDSRGSEPVRWSGRISLTEGEDERGRYIECLDNGVGMSVEQLKSTFTQAGRRFGQTRAFRQEQAAWLRHDQSLRLYPNSRFGIGVFSYFMLADEMSIVTRPVAPDGTVAGRGLRVDISSSGSLFRIQEYGRGEGGCAEGGTRVRLYLRDSARAVSCLATLRELVLVSEFDLRVSDASGREKHWRAGELQPPAEADGTWAVEAVPGVLWWVADGGAVLCDGIRTDKKPFGYVLNLTGPHAGELSVNRKKLQSYDHRWATAMWREGAGALASSSGLSFEWLWTLESRNPSAARQLWRDWQGKGLRMDAWGAPKDLDTVGWFHWDANVMRSSPAPYRNENRWAYTRAWRAAALGNRHLARQEPAPASLAGYPVPEPGWAGVVSAVTQDWRTAVAAAYAQGVTVAAVLRAARALRVAHPRLAPPAVRRPGDLEWVPDTRDSQIMKGLLGPEAEPWQKREGNNYRHSPDDLGGLVRASAAAHLPLGDLARAAERYAPFLRAPVAAVPEHHDKHVCDNGDLQILYLEENDAWRRTRWPWDVVRIARRLHLDPHSVRERLALFDWLGWTAPSERSVERWDRLPFDILNVVVDYLLPTEDGGVELAWGATVKLAAQWEVSLRKAEKELSRWAALLGLRHTRRYRKGTGKGVHVEPDTAALLSSAYTCGIRPENGLTLRDLAYARPHDMDWEGLSYAVEELQTAGLDVPPAGALLRSWSAMPLTDQYLFSGQDTSFDASDYPVLPTGDVLYSAALLLRSPLGKTWKRARRCAKGLGLTVPPLPAELADLRPGREEAGALLGWGDDDDDPLRDGEWFEPPRWAPLTADRLAEYARALHIGPRDAYRRLSRLRPVGALVPELTEGEVGCLPQERPEAEDQLALKAELRVSAAGSPLVPLDLVGIAARLGEDVRRSWRRVAPYLCMEETPRLPGWPQPAVPEVLPLWQDLILLSAYGDGMLPALHGPVSAHQVSFAAHATGATEAWVRERLRLYAPLFELTMEDEVD
ncbi:caspase family protein [Streptomyces sp. NPDC093546]|uniref:HD domain-containing protein n=1 Tax=Streptomyces sp. NPDC093546 TaxID=3366040 RepID=UPI003818CE3D